MTLVSYRIESQMYLVDTYKKHNFEGLHNHREDNSTFVCIGLQWKMCQNRVKNKRHQCYQLSRYFNKKLITKMNLLWLLNNYSNIELNNTSTSKKVGFLSNRLPLQYIMFASLISMKDSSLRCPIVCWKRWSFVSIVTYL